MDHNLRNKLKLFPIWDIINDTEKEILLQESRIETYDKNERISYSNQTCKGLVLIVSGRIRAYILSEEGREVSLYHLHEGDICALSASCLLDSIVFDVIIESTSKTEVIVIPTSVFHSLQEKNPQLELFLLRISNERFSDVMWTMQQILFMSADKRVAIYLYDEYVKTKKKQLHVTHEEVAKYIGTAREVVTRVLKYFVDENIVSLGRGKIEIIDLEKLKFLCD